MVNDRKSGMLLEFVRQFFDRAKGAVARPSHDMRLIARLRDLVTPDIAISLVVIHDSDAPGGNSGRAHLEAPSNGSSTVNSAPPNSPRANASTEPPSSVTASFTIVNPRPVPPGVVVGPGNQISARDSPSMPGPLSKTLSKRPRPFFSVRTTICRSTGCAFS